MPSSAVSPQLARVSGEPWRHPMWTVRRASFHSLEKDKTMIARHNATHPTMSPRVENMRSRSTGNPIPDQFIIYTTEGTYFQSCQSTIAFKPSLCSGERTVLDAQYWDYNPTTMKYLNCFLDANSEQVRQRIKDGQYKLADLNCYQSGR